MQIAKLRPLALSAALLYAAQAISPAQMARAFEHRAADRVVDGHGHVLDSRYSHGHYYPVVGVSVRVLPEGYRPYFLGGHPYYFYGGVWYAPAGAGFVVVRAQRNRRPIDTTATAGPRPKRDLIPRYRAAASPPPMARAVGVSTIAL